MLLRCEQIKQDIMLWAHTEVMPDLFHLLKEIVLKNTTMTRAFRNQARQHRDSRRFASSVMPKQGKDLAIVHLQVDAIDS